MALVYIFLRRACNRVRCLQDAPDGPLVDDCDVGIVGGGIAGLALGLSLHTLDRSLVVRIYEKDPTFASRNQGYGLTIQQGGKSLSLLGISDTIAGEDSQLLTYPGPSSLSSCPEDTPSIGHFIYRPTGDLIGFFGGA